MFRCLLCACADCVTQLVLSKHRLLPHCLHKVGASIMKLYDTFKTLVVPVLALCLCVGVLHAGVLTCLLAT